MNEKMLAKFTDICLNRLQTIESFVMQIESGMEAEEDVVVLMRELHTLKGESRIMNLIEMSDVVHVIEDAMLWRNESEYEAPEVFFNLIYEGLDTISGMCADGLIEIAEEHLESARDYIQTLTSWLANPSDDSPANGEHAEIQGQVSSEQATEANTEEPQQTEAASEVNQDDHSVQNVELETSVEVKCVRRLGEIVAQAQQAPLTDEEFNSIHPLLHALSGHAPTEPIKDLSEAFHFVIGWVLEQVFMVEDEAFFIIQDGLEFLEALLQNQVPEPEEAIGGFLAHLGGWVESTIQEPPTIPEPESLEVPEPVLRLLGFLEDEQGDLSATDLSATEEAPSKPAPELTSTNEKARTKSTDKSDQTVASTVKKSETTSTPKGPPAPKPKRKKKTKPKASSGEGKKEKRVEPTFIQIEIEQVEALTHISGELQLQQAQIEKVSKDLDRLTKDWGELVHTEIVEQKRMQSTSGVSSQMLAKWIKMQALAKEFAAHLNQLREGVLVNNVNLEEFQHRVGEIRLQKIGELFNRFPRSIRDLAKEQGKKIQVVLEGTDVSIDKTVIEALFDPMLHLVRNGVDHGIELPEERIAQGKPERATLRLHAERYGDTVKLSIQDDGRGIDPKRIQETLKRKQLMPENEIHNMNEHQLIQQLFRPGFSTQVTVSHISGRGVGLDVVKSTVEKLGGNIIVESEVGVGTSFNLTLPISVALTYALLVRIHEGYFAFPIQSAEKVLQINRDDVLSVGEGEAARMDDGTLLPLVGLGSLLEFGESHNSNKVDNVVLLQNGTHRVCVRVDSILGVRQLVQSNLPNFIRDLRIVSGTSMIEGGMVVQFLNVMYLLDLAQEYRKRSVSGKQKSTQNDVVRIMIAEDSDLTREMLVSRVSRMGYQVFEAVNGQDAWDQLTYRDVDLVMTDLDMPILNGFELIRKLRSDRKTQDLPIVVLSTRRTKESKQQAAQAGADAYIVKSAYNEEELQRTFNRLLTNEG